MEKLKQPKEQDNSRNRIGTAIAFTIAAASLVYAIDQYRTDQDKTAERKKREQEDGERMRYQNAQLWNEHQAQEKKNSAQPR